MQNEVVFEDEGADSPSDAATTKKPERTSSMWSFGSSGKLTPYLVRQDRMLTAERCYVAGHVQGESTSSQTTGSGAMEDDRADEGGRVEQSKHR